MKNVSQHIRKGSVPMHEVLKIGTHTQQSKPLFTIYLWTCLSISWFLNTRYFINTISLEVCNYSKFRVYKHNYIRATICCHFYMITWKCICSNTTRSADMDGLETNLPKWRNICSVISCKEAARLYLFIFFLLLKKNPSDQTHLTLGNREKEKKKKREIKKKRRRRRRKRKERA